MELFTNDLLLKTATADDAEEVARMWEFEKGSISTEAALEAIDYMQNNHRKNREGYIYHLCFAVFERNGNKIIGWCGLDGMPAEDGRERMEIFYMIDKDYRGRGYATQCAGKLLEYAFETAKISKVFGGCFKDNISSFKVMAKSEMINYKTRENGDPKFYIDSEIYFKLKAFKENISGG